MIGRFRACSCGESFATACEFATLSTAGLFAILPSVRTQTAWTQSVKGCGTAAAVACLLSLGLAWEAAAAPAQSLADVARQEQERRKNVKEPSKVYTNEDLNKYPANPPPPDQKTAQDKPAANSTGAAKPDAAKPAAAAGEKPAPAPDAPVRDEQYWRGRITSARDALARSETFRDALQSRINVLTTDFVNRDDPAQRAAIAFDRQKSLAELDRVQADIQSQTKQIADIEEEARRAGVPPGWLR